MIKEGVHVLSDVDPCGLERMKGSKCCLRHFDGRIHLRGAERLGGCLVGHFNLESCIVDLQLWMFK